MMLIAFSTQTAQGANKRLVFVTIDADATPASGIESFAALPNVDGLGLELQWLKLEPHPGKYDWSTADTAIRIAAKHKKYVTLYLLRSPRPPEWLTEGGKAQTFFSGTISRGMVVDTVPWDKVYLAAYSRFLQAAAQHFKSLNMTPYIFAVGTVAPERDCTIEGSRNGMLGTTVYNRGKYLLACEQMIDSYATSFPTARQFVAAPSDARICLPQRDPEFFHELMTYAITKHRQGCWLFARDLTSAGSGNSAPYTPSFNQRTGIAYQICAGTAEEATPENFNRAVTVGLSNGAIYFEIAPAFAANGNPSIQQTIDRIHRN
jgi:hypothetical protein